MKESWVCRDYERGDEHQILSLFAEVFQREMSLAFWKWRFIENPFGKGIIKVLFDDDKLIGHYAVIPMNVEAQGRLLKAAFSMTTMTHPDYGGRGIFTYLAEETYKLCHQRGCHFVYGFPNKNSYYGFTHKLGWHGFGHMAALEKKLQSSAKTTSIAKATKQIEHFDDTINSLWDKAKQDYTIIVPRTEEFMNWRFVENPDTDYLKCIILDDNSDISGYVILKVYAKGDVVKGHIVDMLSMPDREVVKLLLEYSYHYFLERGIYDISCWMPENSFYSGILQKEGFARRDTETYFGVRVFSEGNLLAKSTEQLSNWFITMADSDAF